MAKFNPQQLRTSMVGMGIITPKQADQETRQRIHTMVRSVGDKAISRTNAILARRAAGH